ncbi:hypothetical protein [Aeromonas caviae]|uniref:hypothetical protein n=1 Tax=Aeromonas caviae TaxID=648 RepID=UPI003CE8D82F
MSDTKNIRLGTCKVFFNDQDLGLTIGGVELEVTTSTHETKVDQFGETVVEEIITGRNVKVTVPLGETTLENMVRIMPGAKLVTDATDPTKKRVDVSVATGQSLLSTAKALRLHPVALPDTNKSEDVIIPKAGTAGAVKFSYKNDQERVYNVEFKAYPDTTTGLLLSFGNPDFVGK